MNDHLWNYPTHYKSGPVADKAPRAGCAWTAAERDDLLRGYLTEGLSIPSLAQRHDRGALGVSIELNRLMSKSGSRNSNANKQAEMQINAQTNQPGGLGKRPETIAMDANSRANTASEFARVTHAMLQSSSLMEAKIAKLIEVGDQMSNLIYNLTGTAQQSKSCHQQNVMASMIQCIRNWDSVSINARTK